MRILLGLVCLCLISCSFQWQRPTGYREILPLVTSSSHLVGSGLKITWGGKAPHRCLNKFETTSEYGELTVRTQLLDETFHSHKPGLTDFVKANLNQLKKLPRDINRPIAPISFLLDLNVEDKKVFLVDNTTEMAPWVWELIKRKGLNSFFEFCGTKVVRSATFESSAFVFISYFPKTIQEREAIKNISRSTLKGTKQNLFRLDTFNQIPINSATFVSLTTDTTLPTAPPDWTQFAQKHKSFGTFLNSVSTMLTQTESGKLIDYEAVPWRKLNEGRLLFSSSNSTKREPFYKEQANDSLSRLADLTFSFQQLQGQIDYWLKSDDKGYQQLAKACHKVIREQLFLPTTEQLDKCQQQYASTPNALPISLTECNLLFHGEFQIFSSRSCRSLAALEPQLKKPLLQWEAHTPFELASQSNYLRWSDHKSISGTLNNDVDTYLSIPPSVSLGDSMNSAGKLYETNCILPPKSDQTDDNNTGQEKEEPPNADSEGLINLSFIKSLLEDDPNAIPLITWDETKWDEKLDNNRFAQTESAPNNSSSTTNPLSGNTSTSLPEPIVQDRPQQSQDAKDSKKINGSIDQAPSNRSLEEPLPEETIELWEAKDHSLTQTTQINGYRSWPWLKELLLFWKTPPKPRAIYRSVIQIHGSTRLMAPTFELTEEAKQLASTDLKKFMDLCGTHYVSQIQHRRGLIYYYTQGSPGDVEIQVIPFGVPKDVYQDQIFKPNRAQDFFENQSSMLSKLKVSDHAIPELLRLEPWINYLIIRDIVKPMDIKILH